MLENFCLVPTLVGSTRVLRDSVESRYASKQVDVI